MSEYTQGVSGDGAVILKDGQPLTVEQILEELQAERQRGYSQGYAAGRRKAEAEATEAQKVSAQRRAWFAFYRDALANGPLSVKGWSQDGETVTKPRQYANIAKSMADAGVDELLKNYGRHVLFDMLPPD